MPAEIDEVLVINHDICDNFFYVADGYGDGGGNLHMVISMTTTYVS